MIFIRSSLKLKKIVPIFFFFITKFFTNFSFFKYKNYHLIVQGSYFQEVFQGPDVSESLGSSKLALPRACVKQYTLHTHVSENPLYVADLVTIPL